MFKILKQILNFSLNLGTSKTAKNLYWVFSGNAVSIILAFLTTILLARVISKEEFGIYLALFTFANLLADLGEAGIAASLSSFLPPLIADKKTEVVRSYVASAFYLEIGIGIILAVFASQFSTFLAAKLFANTSSLNVFITALTTLALIVFNFVTFTLAAFKKFQQSTVINIFYGLVRLGIIILLYLTNSLNLTTILLAFFLAPVIGWIYSFVHIKVVYALQTTDKQIFKTLLHFASQLSVQKIFIAVSSRLDMLMLVPLASASEAGIYGVASRISQVYPFVVSSFAQVVAPKFAEYKNPKEAVGFLKKSFLVCISMFFSLILFFIFARPIIVLLFGDKYIEAVSVFQSLLLSMFGFVLAIPFTTFIIYTLKKPKITMFASGIQLLIIFLTNFVMIPKYGRFGPAIGIGIGNIAVLMIAVVASWYYLTRQDENWN